MTELSAEWQQAYVTAYDALASSKVKLLLATYFGQLLDNLSLLRSCRCRACIWMRSMRRAEVDAVIEIARRTSVLSLGVINGRNIWKNDLDSGWMARAGREATGRAPLDRTVLLAAACAGGPGQRKEAGCGSPLVAGLRDCRSWAN